MALTLKSNRAMLHALSFFLVLALLFATLVAPNANAQVINWGPSVTSMGFGGSNHLGGVPSSVTSLGFGRIGGQHDGEHPGFHTSAGPGFDGFGSRHHRPFYPSWGGYYAYPIFIDSSDAYVNGSEPVVDPDEYRGGPTIFDRRGAEGQYPPPGSRRPEPTPQAIEAKAAPLPVVEVANQPQTILVFKDGHKSSVDNYAIVGNVLYDLSGGKRRRIALADLDLTATAQQNDDRGVDFQLPSN